MKCRCLHGAPWFADCPACCTGTHRDGTVLWTDLLLGRETLITPEAFAAALTEPERQELLRRLRHQLDRWPYLQGITE